MYYNTPTMNPAILISSKDTNKNSEIINIQSHKVETISLFILLILFCLWNRFSKSKN